MLLSYHYLLDDAREDGAATVIVDFRIKHHILAGRRLLRKSIAVETLECFR